MHIDSNFSLKIEGFAVLITSEYWKRYEDMNFRAEHACRQLDILEKGSFWQRVKLLFLRQ